MAENIVKLRRRAKELGVDSEIVRSGDRSELTAAIRKASKNGSASVAKKKRVVKSAVEAPRKRGRPPGSKNKPKTAAAASTKKSPVKSRPKAGETKRTSSGSRNGNAGRLLVGDLDFRNYDEDDWSPREESRTGIIFDALKRNKGNVEKTFSMLAPDVNDLIPRKKRNGELRSKDERLAMLRYHIHQVRWRFAIQTGQHEKGSNRVQYGTGGYAQEHKPKRGRPAKKAAVETPAPRKRGRPRKVVAEEAEAPLKRRGRPPGSKNKKKTRR